MEKLCSIDTVLERFSALVSTTVQVSVASPRLSQAGMPSRSEGWGGLFKARAERDPYRCPRSAPIDIRSADATIYKVASRL